MPARPLSTRLLTMILGCRLRTKSSVFLPQSWFQVPSHSPSNQRMPMGPYWVSSSFNCACM